MKRTIKKIGILGGGQLARMLALQAHKEGLEPHIFSTNKKDPAAQVSSFWTKGRLDSLKDLEKFLKHVDVVIFENEFVHTEYLLKAMKKTKTPVIPHPKIIEKLQDRWTQKQWLKQYNIPTAPFVKIDTFDELLKAFHTYSPLVLKTRRGGYDGYGTFIVRSLKDCKKIQHLFKKHFCGFIGEAFIPFQKELAVILASHKKSKVISLPLVETFQKDFRCYWVKGPVSHLKFKQLLNKLKVFVKKIHYEGVIAFELFHTADGRLWVNEIAPRVHNSGHYSLDALSTDQFALHLSAVLKHPLHTPSLLSPSFAMLNLLGKKESHKDWKKIKDIYLHDYGKHIKRKGRKMGHLNALSDTPQKALSKLFRAEKHFN